MANKKNKCSVAKAIRGKEVIYLSNTDIEKGLDIQLDLLGYTIYSI